jgi:hypothetical protein
MKKNIARPRRVIRIGIEFEPVALKSIAAQKTVFTNALYGRHLRGAAFLNGKAASAILPSRTFL